jgi:spore germination protein GerM
VLRKAVVVALAIVAVSSACRKKETPSSIAIANKVAVREVRLYFEGDNMLLQFEKRSVSVPENPAGAISVVARELMKGPATATFYRVYPADTVIRAAYLLPDGTAFVDLGGPTLMNGWGTGTHAELMAVASLVQTLAANFPEVKKVRLLINGEPAETLAGHINLGRSLAPMTSLVDPRAR